VKTYGSDKVIYPEQFTCVEGEVPALEDTLPGNFFLANSIIGLVWWILMMVIYVKNVDTYNLQNAQNRNTVPIGWFWDNLGNVKYGYTAMAYFISFWLMMATHLIEFIGWFFYAENISYWVSWWIKNIGMWLNTVGLFIPVLMIILQLTVSVNDGGLGELSANKEFGNNAIFLLIIDSFIWVWSGLIHILLADRFMCHTKAVEEDLIMRKGAPCTVKRNFMMTDEEYEAACEAIALVK